MIKLKTAVCLSGHLRRFQQNFSALKKHLLDNSNLDCDIFIHTWTELDKRGGKTNQLVLSNMYHPKKIIVEPKRIFRTSPFLLRNNPNKRDINGLISMFYKIKACNDLKCSYEAERGFIYDCVIRLRPDILLHQDVPIDIKTNLNKLYVPKYGDYTGLNDQFAFSNSYNMNAYSSTFNNIERFVQSGIFVNPELFTLQTVKENNMIIERPEISYDIIWYNGQVFNNLTRFNHV